VEKEKRSYRAYLRFALVLFALLTIAWSPEARIAKNILKKDPHHKDNIPEKPACPIDGLWKDSYYGYRYGIEKGRLFDMNRNIVHGRDLSWPMVSIKDIVRVAPGKYRGLTMVGSNKWKPCTLTVLEGNKIAQKSKGKSIQIYEYIRLSSSKWFDDDYTAMQAGVAIAPINRAVPSERSPPIPKKRALELKSVGVHPRAIKPGDTFDFEFKYMASDSISKNGTLPVQYQCSIIEGKKVLLESNPSIIQSSSGLTMSKVIKLKGSNKKGVYTIKICISYKDLVENGSAELTVCDNPKRRPEG
jgi:hypothetical protein